MCSVFSILFVEKSNLIKKTIDLFDVDIYLIFGDNNGVDGASIASPYS